MFTNQCRAVNGTYNCHKIGDHNGHHAHHFPHKGEHYVATWAGPHGEMTFRSVRDA